jgi:hypothetical protein|tara:strand:- start:134 stop:277 length:144 start_codon:yes stop_codon:yes gene_type:complete
MIDDSIELKKLKEEIEIHKKTIDQLQTDNDIKDYEITELKEALENTE